VVQVRKGDVAERSGNSLGLIEPYRLAHRTAGVEKQVDRQVPLFIEQPKQQPVQPLVGIPVDVPEVVAWRVLSMVGELESPSTLLRRAVRPMLSGERTPGDHVQVLELLQQIRFKSKGHGVGACPDRWRSLRVGRHGREHFTDERIRIGLLGLALEIEQQPVAQGRKGRRSDVVD